LSLAEVQQLACQLAPHLCKALRSVMSFNSCAPFGVWLSSQRANRVGFREGWVRHAPRLG